MEHLTPIRVYIEDTDAGGIVYYVNYLKFMERARTELLRELGYQQCTLKEEGRLFVVAAVEARYRRPARLDDALVVRTRLARISNASVTFVQAVTPRDSQSVLCEAEIKVACVAAETLRPAPIPRPVLAGFERYRERDENSALRVY